MARFSEKSIPYETQERLMNLFCDMLAKLHTRKTIHDFLKDLLNRQERIMLIRRLMIAELLERGYTYREIREQLHCGNSTIARVERWLRFGRGGYKAAIKVLIKNLLP